MGIYALLFLAIAVEVIATTALKASDGFTRLGPGAVVVVGYSISFYLMTIILRRLDLGIVYATWSALGTAGVAMIGVSVYGETMTLWRAAGLLLVIIGVVILNISGTTAP